MTIYCNPVDPAVSHFNSCWGLYHPSKGRYEWYGHSFNPTSEPGFGSTWDYWDDYNYGDTDGYNWETYGGIDAFDLTGFQQGNEVCMGLFCHTWENTDISTGYTVYFWGEILDPDGHQVRASVLYSFWLPAYAVDYHSWLWLGIGVKSSGHGEISKNGTYTLRFHAYYNYAWYTSDTTFTVTNFPAATQISEVGKLWVDGEDLCFSSYQNRWVIKPKNNGVNYGYADSGDERKFYIDAEGRISWIGETLKKYKTKKGDKYGYGEPGFTTQIPDNIGASHAREIGISIDDNDTYLIIVGNSGDKYRIGAGFVFTGDFQ